MSSARPSLGCHAGQARGCWEHVPSSQGLGDPGLTRRPCTGWAVAQGSRAIVLLLLLPRAQGFEWQAAHLGGTWRPLQACCLHIPASRFPPGRVPPQDSALAFASEAVARQPRPWVHRGGMGSALEAVALWLTIQTQFRHGFLLPREMFPKRASPLLHPPGSWQACQAVRAPNGSPALPPEPPWG